MANKPLYVPANISLKKVIWQGFGWEEAWITGGIGFVSGIILAYLLRQSHIDVFAAMTSEIVVIASVGGVLQKVENNLSMVDFIKIMIGFYKNQQEFRFIYSMEEIHRDEEVKKRNTKKY